MSSKNSFLMRHCCLQSEVCLLVDKVSASVFQTIAVRVSHI